MSTVHVVRGVSPQLHPIRSPQSLPHHRRSLQSSPPLDVGAPPRDAGLSDENNENSALQSEMDDAVDGEVLRTTKAIWSLSWPQSIVSTVESCFFLVDTVYMGSQGEDALAAGAFAASVVGLAETIIACFCVTANSLVAQAVGARNFRLCGTWIFLAGMAILAVSIILAPLSLAAVRIGGHYVDLDPGLQASATKFAAILSLRFFPYGIFSLLSRVCMCFDNSKQSAVVSVGSVVATVLLNYLFVVYLNFGLIGTAISACCVAAIRVVVFAAWVWKSKLIPRACLHGARFGRLSMARVKAFAQLAFGTLLCDSSDHLAFLVFTLAAARLSTELQAVNGGLRSLWDVLWAVYWGVPDATQTIVGQLLAGRGEPPALRRVIVIGLCLSLAINCVFSAQLILQCAWWAAIFRVDEEKFCTVAPYTAIASQVATVGYVLTMALEGLGKAQHAGVGAVLGVAVGAVASEVGATLFGLRGVWLGAFAYGGVRFFLSGVALLRLDLDLVANEARGRSNLTPQPMMAQPTLAILEARHSPLPPFELPVPDSFDGRDSFASNCGHAARPIAAPFAAVVRQRQEGRSSTPPALPPPTLDSVCEASPKSESRASERPASRASALPPKATV